MERKYKVGDVITKIYELDMFTKEQLPAEIIALGKLHNWYIVGFADGWLARESFSSFENYEHFLREHSEDTKVWVLLESNIIEVKSQNKAYNLPAILTDKNSSLYEIARAELRERIRKEEEQRPKNAAFEFL